MRLLLVLVIAGLSFSGCVAPTQETGHMVFTCKPTFVSTGVYVEHAPPVVIRLVRGGAACEAWADPRLREVINTHQTYRFVVAPSRWRGNVVYRAKDLPSSAEYIPPQLLAVYQGRTLVWSKGDIEPL